MEKLGAYYLEKPIGKGATAQVFLATDTRTQARVALKVFHPGIQNNLR